MTPKQRAIGVIAQIGRYSPSKEIQELIEEAITAGIEEEREACAKECDQEAIKQHRKNNQTGHDMVAVACGDRIRARSQSKGD